MAKLEMLQPISLSFQIDISVPLAIDIDDTDRTSKQAVAHVHAAIREALGEIILRLDDVYEAPAWPG